MNDLTKNVLKSCWEVGYKRVTIGVIDERVPESAHDWINVEGWIFAWPPEIYIDWWPALWSILEKFNLRKGLGQKHSYYNSEHGLTKGHYDLEELFGEKDLKTV